MMRKIIFGTAIALTAMLIWDDIGLRQAAACNKIAGCIMDNISENYDMMHSDKMKKAMEAGKDNIDAFNRLREAERNASSRKVSK